MQASDLILQCKPDTAELKPRNCTSPYVRPRSRNLGLPDLNRMEWGNRFVLPGGPGMLIMLCSRNVKAHAL